MWNLLCTYKLYYPRNMAQTLKLLYSHKVYRGRKFGWVSGSTNQKVNIGFWWTLIHDSEYSHKFSQVVNLIQTTSFPNYTKAVFVLKPNLNYRAVTLFTNYVFSHFRGLVTFWTILIFINSEKVWVFEGIIFCCLNLIISCLLIQHPHWTTRTG